MESRTRRHASYQATGRFEDNIAINSLAWNASTHASIGVLTRSQGFRNESAAGAEVRVSDAGIP
jgi:hypothetical protein